MTAVSRTRPSKLMITLVFGFPDNINEYLSYLFGNENFEANDIV